MICLLCCFLAVDFALFFFHCFFFLAFAFEGSFWSGTLLLLRTRVSLFHVTFRFPRVRLISLSCPFIFSFAMCVLGYFTRFSCFALLPLSLFNVCQASSAAVLTGIERWVFGAKQERVSSSKISAIPAKERYLFIVGLHKDGGFA